MAYIVKVEHEGSLRRLLISRAGEEDLSFAEFETRVHDAFKLPSDAQLKMTYRDSENDVVTVANDHDLTDACVTQKINPLRLHVSVVPSQTAEENSNMAPAAAPLPPSSDAEEQPSASVRRIVGLYEPLLRELVPASQISELMDEIVKMVIVQLSNIMPLEKGDSSFNPTSVASQSKEAAEHSPAIHTNVCCDVCHESPIVGPRFKSLKKFDYDLCVGCYEKGGDANEYMRIEQPLSPRQRVPAFVALERLSPARVRCGGVPRLLGPGLRHGGGRCRRGYIMRSY